MSKVMDGTVLGKCAGDKPASVEQMKLARLCAQLTRVTMENQSSDQGVTHSRGVFQQPDCRSR
jgi:hypothetical protein